MSFYEILRFMLFISLILLFLNQGNPTFEIFPCIIFSLMVLNGFVVFIRFVLEDRREWREKNIAEKAPIGFRAGKDFNIYKCMSCIIIVISALYLIGIFH